MVSWLVRSVPHRAVRVQALAGDIVLCSWARYFALTVPLSTQVYKWVPANLMLGIKIIFTCIWKLGLQFSSEKQNNATLNNTKETRRRKCNRAQHSVTSHNSPFNNKTVVWKRARCGGALAYSSPGQGSWTLTVPLSTQVYKWVLVK